MWGFYFFPFWLFFWGTQQLEHHEMYHRESQHLAFALWMEKGVKTPVALQCFYSPEARFLSYCFPPPLFFLFLESKVKGLLQNYLLYWGTIKLDMGMNSPFQSINRLKYLSNIQTQMSYGSSLSSHGQTLCAISSGRAHLSE